MYGTAIVWLPVFFMFRFMVASYGASAPRQSVWIGATSVISTCTDRVCAGAGILRQTQSELYRGYLAGLVTGRKDVIQCWSCCITLGCNNKNAEQDEQSRAHLALAFGPLNSKPQAFHAVRGTTTLLPGRILSQLHHEVARDRAAASICLLLDAAHAYRVTSRTSSIIKTALLSSAILDMLVEKEVAGTPNSSPKFEQIQNQNILRRRDREDKVARFRHARRTGATACGTGRHREDEVMHACTSLLGGRGHSLPWLAKRPVPTWCLRSVLSSRQRRCSFEGGDLISFKHGCGEPLLAQALQVRNLPSIIFKSTKLAVWSPLNNTD